MYRYLIRPLLFTLFSAETAHRLGAALLRLLGSWGPLRRACERAFAFRSPLLHTELWGKQWLNPIAVAAGFDKNAEMYEGLAALGFGAVEVGTVTAEGQAGNPKPRLFRLPQDAALINRMGFNNAGAWAVARRLDRPRSVPLGVNIGKTRKVAEEEAIADYVRSAEILTPYADYVVVNVSSPNTPGLRGWQEPEKLKALLSAVRKAMRRATPGRSIPLLVKIAPDLSDEALDAIADLALQLGLEGIVATNTTESREGLQSEATKVEACGKGGLSGRPLRRRSLQVLRRLRARVGERLVLISAGGIENVDDLWERMRAGATFVQIYSAFVYEGPLLAHRLARGLKERIEAAGLSSLDEARALWRLEAERAGGEMFPPASVD